MNSPEADERGQRLLSELRLLLMRQAADPFRLTPIPSLTLARSAATSPCMIAGLYAPMVCIIAQGSKQVVVGNSTLDYDTGKYLVSSVDLPVSARIWKPLDPGKGGTLPPKLLCSILVVRLRRRGDFTKPLEILPVR